MKRQSRRISIATFSIGLVLMLVGTAVEIYDLVLAVAMRPTFNLFEVVVDFIIPLALIYFGYHILTLKEFRFPSILKG